MCGHSYTYRIRGGIDATHKHIRMHVNAHEQMVLSVVASDVDSWQTILCLQLVIEFERNEIKSEIAAPLLFTGFIAYICACTQIHAQRVH